MPWRETLGQLVTSRGTDRSPLLVFKLEPPAGGWPDALPGCPALRDLYALCDGGPLSLQYTLEPASELTALTDGWRTALADDDVLEAGGHVVLGHDSGGAALVWDAATDAMATYFAAGGGWEPLDTDAEGFLQALLTEPARVHAGCELWTEALQQLAESGRMT